MDNISRKKRLVQISTVCNGSVGKIMGQIQRYADSSGWETMSLYGRRKGFHDLKCKKFGNGVSFWIHVGITTLFDKQGFGSYFVTRRMVSFLRHYQPDVIHLHNLHGYYLHLDTLFRYLKEEFQGEVVWTLHDCWAFTGHCAYFTIAGCDKWKIQCENCTNKKQYPISLGADASKQNYIYKKQLFSGMNHLTILVPSKWLEGIVKESFLKEYPVKVIPNGVDLNVFSPIHDSQILEKYKIPLEKKVLLGVASIWEPRKGLDVFLELSKMVDESYVIVLVGVSKIQKRKLKQYGIIGIERTECIEELVKLYSMAHIFVNPSREETFSMVTLEALCCGTPVIVSKDGATNELVGELGIVVEKEEATTYLNAIENVSEHYPSIENMRNWVQKYQSYDIMKRLFQIYKESDRS